MPNANCRYFCPHTSLSLLIVLIGCSLSLRLSLLASAVCHRQYIDLTKSQYLSGIFSLTSSVSFLRLLARYLKNFLFTLSHSMPCESWMSYSELTMLNMYSLQDSFWGFSPVKCWTGSIRSHGEKPPYTMFTIIVTSTNRDLLTQTCSTGRSLAEYGLSRLSYFMETLWLWSQGHLVAQRLFWNNASCRFLVKNVYEMRTTGCISASSRNCRIDYLPNSSRISYIVTVSSVILL